VDNGEKPVGGFSLGVGVGFWGEGFLDILKGSGKDPNRLGALAPLAAEWGQEGGGGDLEDRGIGGERNGGEGKLDRLTDLDFVVSWPKGSVVEAEPALSKDNGVGLAWNNVSPNLLVEAGYIKGEAGYRRDLGLSRDRLIHYLFEAPGADRGGGKGEFGDCSRGHSS
jgi:hypothetical protein